jgi:hypothetical protein
MKVQIFSSFLFWMRKTIKMMNSERSIFHYRGRVVMVHDLK